ncbi:MAG: rRNA maturation RNase YbeY [Alphaproteobacteria bacterium]|nr:MAG: rRNA maturation RNase YbeY [Alphaproteobacteria bacterium]
MTLEFIVKDQRWAVLLEEAQDTLTDLYLTLLSDHNINQENVEISVMLTDDAEIQDLNHRYRNKDQATDVLSFQQYEDIDTIQAALSLHKISLGDIILSYDTLVKNAESQKKSHGNHFIHLFVHGMLHLLGYDHEHNEEAHEMEQCEIKLLAGYGISDPYRIG